MNSLKTKLMLIIALVTAAALGAISFINYNQSSNILEEQLLNAATNSAEYNAMLVNKWLQGIVNEINTLAENADVQSAEPERCVPVLKRVLNKHDDYEDVFASDKYGNAAIAISDDTIINIADEEYFGKYFKEVMQGKIAISDPLISRATGHRIIIIAAPTYQDNEPSPTGSVGVVVTLNYLQKLVKSMQLGEHGYGLIQNSDMTTIAHPNEKFLGNKTLVDTGNERLKELFQRMSKGEKGYGTYTYQGAEKILAFAPVELTGWSVSQTANVADIMSPVGAIRNASLSVTLIAMIIILGITLLISNVISNPIINLSKIAEVVAHGDFTQPISEKFLRRKDEIGKIAGAMDKILTNLRPLLSSLKGDAKILADNSETLSASSEEIASSSSEVSSAIQEVASGATDQASHLLEVMGLIQKITASLEKVYTELGRVKDNSEETSKLAYIGKQELDSLIVSIRGVRDAFKTVVERLDMLKGSVNHVAEILEVINGITDQTNLFALNAAIEAARAGEAGRGFSVVADEIRKLAEQSRASSDKIGALLNNITSETNEVVATSEEVSKQVISQLENVERTIKAFDDILESIAAIVPMIEATYKEVVSTVKAKDMVIDKVQSVSSVAEETSASAEEIAASAEELSASTQGIASNAQQIMEVAKRLDEQVDRFKV